MNGNVPAKTVFVFAGTTEGRLVIQRLLERGGLHVTAFTATGYGSALLSGMACEIRAGRLGPAEMQREIADARPHFVVDATHPFAVLVSENIRAACAATGTRYLRLKRDVSGGQNCRVHRKERRAAFYRAAFGGRRLFFARKSPRSRPAGTRAAVFAAPRHLLARAPYLPVRPLLG